MSDDDSELQRLQAKRLAEMQKNISSRETAEETPESTKSTEEKIVNPRDTLIKQLGFRGLEVLTNSESQFPNYEKHSLQNQHLCKLQEFPLQHRHE